MPRNDIRLRTRLIVKRGSMFLVGKDLFGKLRWSDSPYDAWYTRDMDVAENVAHAIGGDLWLFNNVIGEAVELSAHAS